MRFRRLSFGPLMYSDGSSSVANDHRRLDGLLYRGRLSAALKSIKPPSHVREQFLVRTGAMKALGFGLVLGVVVVSACSSATPTSDCQHFASVLCQKYFQCAAAAAATQYGTEASCETQSQQTYNCASYACPSNTTYHADKFETCINDINAEQCSALSTPPSCQGITTQAVCF